MNIFTIHFSLLFVDVFYLGLICSTDADIRYEVTEDPETNGNGTFDNFKWIVMPDGRDNLQVAVLSDLRVDDEHNLDLESVKFFLFTRDNAKRAEVRSMNESCKPVFKHFQAKRKTKFIIHGFGDSVKESYITPVLRDAFLSKGDYNIVAVDWSKLAAKPWYVTAKKNTRPVAKHIAKFIDHMSSTVGMKPKNVHIVGFSLGAHIAGLAANNVRSGRVKHVTGLDPASVLYDTSGPHERLDSSHADLVEVIHTTGGYIGFQTNLGHRDFYPNGGLWPQPGCVLDYAAVCSHRRAYYYYGEAVTSSNSFVGVACNSYEQFLKNECDVKKTTPLELEFKNTGEKKYGMFFLNTPPQPPFG